MEVLKLAAPLVLFTSLIFSVQAQEPKEPQGESYLQNSVITMGADKHEQARDWAMCSAAFEVMSAIYEESQPATSKRLADTGRGAQVAILMVYVFDALQGDEETQADRFAASYNMGKVFMESLKESASTRLASDFEMMSQQGTEQDWFLNVAATGRECSLNGEMQQIYVDLWREIAASGLLTSEE